MTAHNIIDDKLSRSCCDVLLSLTQYVIISVNLAKMVLNMQTPHRQLNDCSGWLLIYFQGSSSSWPLRKLSLTRVKQFRMYRALEWVDHELASVATQWMAQLVTGEVRGVKNHLTYISSSSNGLALMVAIIQRSFLNQRPERFYNCCMCWPINIVDMLISQPSLGTKNLSQHCKIFSSISLTCWIFDALIKQIVHWR